MGNQPATLQQEKRFRLTFSVPVSRKRSEELKRFISDAHAWMIRIDEIMCEALEGRHNTLNRKSISVNVIEKNRGCLSGIVEWDAADCSLPRVANAIVLQLLPTSPIEWPAYIVPEKVLYA